jgi:hypothetical protein
MRVHGFFDGVTKVVEGGYMLGMWQVHLKMFQIGFHCGLCFYALDCCPIELTNT